jgi:hypothetical protein
MINAWETRAGLISLILVILYAVTVFVWGLADGRADARANPDPDRRGDLSMTWLLAGLFAGIVSGAIAWFIHLFYKSLYVEGLINELTTFAAFTALVVFLGAISGVTVGRWRIDRAGAYRPQSKGDGDEDRADTDVFAAVRSDQAATEGGAEWPQEQPTAVATAERDEHETPTAHAQDAEQRTEAVTAAPSEDKTAKVPWPPSADKTEVLPTHESAEPTEHIRTQGEPDKD